MPPGLSFCPAVGTASSLSRLKRQNRPLVLYRWLPLLFLLKQWVGIHKSV